MKTIIYIVLIVMLVAALFVGVKVLADSSLFSTVKGAYDTVKDFVEDGDKSDSESGQSDNQNENTNEQGQQSGGGQVPASEMSVSEIYDPSLCGLFTLKKSGALVASSIRVGDVFETGDTIYCNQSLYSDAALVDLLDEVDYFICYKSTSLYTYWGAYIFGNSCIDVRKVISTQNSSVAVYYIYVGDQIVWKWDGMTIGWCLDSVTLDLVNHSGSRQ